MHNKRAKKQVLEGVIRRDGSAKSARPMLDPFAKKQTTKPKIGMTQSVGAGAINVDKSLQKPVVAAPKFDMELEDTEEPKQKGSRRKRRSDKVRSPKHKLFRRLVLGTLVAVILSGSFIGLNIFRAAHKIFRGNADGALALQGEIDPTKLKGEGDGRVNILLAGIGGPGHDGPYLTDTLIIASLDPFAKEISLVSIPRDLWVTTKGFGSGRVNAVMSNSKDYNDGSIPAGMKTLEGTVSESLGIPIHYFTVLDFTAFKDAIDTVGGIDVEVKTKLVDPTIAWENKNNPVIAEAGWQKFDGKRALLFARSRKGTDGDDFHRNERQKLVMIGLKNKVVSVGTFGNPLKMTELINNAGEHVQTDLSINEIKRLYDIVKDVPSDKIKSVSFAEEPNILIVGQNIGGASVQVPRAGIGNFEEIKAFIRSNLVDGFIRKENAQIMVLNGTGVAGLAATKADELKSYGYQISTVGDAGQSQATTQIIEVNKNKAPYSRKYLENRFKVSSAPGSVPTGQTGTPDFVIILGRDAVSQ